MKFDVITKSAVRRKMINALVPELLELLHIANVKGHVTVMTRPNMRKELDCAAHVVEVEKNIFLCQIDSGINLEATSNALSHEFVHVKQYVRKQLVITRKANSEISTIFWRGKKMPSNLEYTDRPWEQEALSKELLLSHKAINAVNKKPLDNK